MAGLLLPYFIPFGVALATAGVLRLLAGPERGARVAGLSILFGFAAAWHWLLLAPWVPVDPLSRVIHIAIGGFAIGFIFDLVRPRRSWMIAIVIIYALGSVWSAISGGLLGPAPDEAGGWLRLVFYLLFWAGLISRLNTVQAEGPSGLVICFMLASGLGLIGQMSGEGAIAAAAYCLAAALAGYLALSWILALAVGNAVILGGGGAVLAVAMALADPVSQASAIALSLLILVPFADGTAKRIPLGPTALRPAVYPLALMGVAMLPVCLAAVTAFLFAGR
ncbi:MAG: hypothetical protein HN793_12415 [Rhodospirillaceae bacterium]|nr:hypothetical protein [Rhodospirillaceae bacterium]MBT5239259.1 hypothetical protein [Rhodospirillaceae bacterium]MBT5566137.1 hypothetical protein [Rhodospirillaceae bacterium]MBT6090606.1 hypothetical protein [Rhodospirillaceae bacterium]MBT7451629.1 hypothetical protein [Rhodospirillaceae bacterium]